MLLSIATPLFQLSSQDICLLQEIVLWMDRMDQFDKEKAYKSAFSTKRFDDQQYRLTISKLYKTLERYVAFTQLSKSENKQINTLLLSKYYRKKNLKKLYKGTAAFAERQKQTGLLVPLDIEFNMEFEHYQYDSLEKRSQELNLQKMLDLTDQSFYAKKLRVACYALSHKAVYSTDYHFNHINEILKEIETRKLFEDPNIGVYYYGYLMIMNPENDKHYHNYTSYLLKHGRLFEFEEKRSLYFFALNRCIRKLNEGDLNYGREGLEMYQQSIQAKIIFINGFLSRFTYRNMAMMAIRINDFDLAEQLTDENEVHLRAEDKSSAYHFNKALINYHKKSLEDALEDIMQSDFKDPLINLAVKTLQAKIYYELKQMKLLNFHLDSMEMYMIRNKVLGSYKKNYKTFIKYCRKIVKARIYKKERVLSLQSNIQNESVLTEKKWLLEQLS